MKTMLRTCLVALTLSASLATATVQAAAAESPQQIVRSSVKQLMSKIDNREGYYRQHPEELEQVIESTIDPIIDWRYVGASVMGKYFQPASPQQRSQFIEAFKQTLLDTYAQGLVTFDYDSINVLDNEQAQRYEDQASVQMEVVSTDGQRYPVSYTLRQRDGEWKVVNVVVNGINLGLTFRNQFDQAMREHNRNYDQVISGWSPDNVDLEEGGQDS